MVVTDSWEIVSRRTPETVYHTNLPFNCRAHKVVLSVPLTATAQEVRKEMYRLRLRCALVYDGVWVDDVNPGMYTGFLDDIPATDCTLTVQELMVPVPWYGIADTTNTGLHTVVVGVDQSVHTCVLLK